jgi:hypothetical protein
MIVASHIMACNKNDSKLDLNNYRPISVLPVIAKVFEKVVFDQTYNFLNNNDLIISKEQSGFRHLHSSLTAMLDATDQWYTNMDNGLINMWRSTRIYSGSTTVPTLYQ